MPKLMLFTGNANPELAEKVAAHIKVPLGQMNLSRFSDGEIMCEILENVRGKDVFIIQPTSSPCNDSIMELVLMADALRRASATRITAVVPYFGYARQDRRVRSARVPISAKVIADMMGSVGINRLLTVDLHADQIQGFFYMPVDNVYATPVFFDDLKQRYGNEFNNLTIVSPDVGGVVRARAVAKRLNDAELAIIDKRRSSANQSEVMHIIGQVENRHCLIMDDIVDTAGTLCNAAKALKDKGARTVNAYCTHPVLSGNALDNITHSMLDELVVTDTIKLSSAIKNCKKIRQISLSALLAEAIYRVNESESISSMFMD